MNSTDNTATPSANRHELPGLSGLPDLPADCRAAASLLNQGCSCRTVDHQSLQHALEGDADFAADSGALSYVQLQTTHPNLFSDALVFVSQAHLKHMARVIAAIERVVALPAYREAVLADAPEIARHAQQSAGVFFGYDFHLGVNGPQLIEINTNAGGALLNAKLLRAQRACSESPAELNLADGAKLEAEIIAMFRAEWQAARGSAPLRRIAIVDENPAAQFLASEFELFRRLFVKDGLDCIVLDPAELDFDGQHLRHGAQVIDLVYNRLTDFSLAEPAQAPLRCAYLADAVLLTPHPQAHALYADKRNLVLLSDDAWLASVGVSPADRDLLLAGIPQTRQVFPENAASFWESRRQWFFKPAAGFGGRATYRGDKLTKRVFAEISEGGYVAQALVPPSLRRLTLDGIEQDLKLDLRNYVYRGEVQLVSARLYQGQTTNFRTPGGGFAAVCAVSSPASDVDARAGQR